MYAWALFNVSCAEFYPLNSLDSRNSATFVPLIQKLNVIFAFLFGVDSSGKFLSSSGGLTFAHTIVIH